MALNRDSVNSKKTYQQDLQRFMDWTQTAWDAVTPRQVVLFKDDLLEEKSLAPATASTLCLLATEHRLQKSSKPNSGKH
jgi:hypothetical protein